VNTTTLCEIIVIQGAEQLRDFNAITKLFLLFLILILVSVGFPLFILMVFDIIFADYYSKVILAGLLHLFIGVIAIMVNATTSVIISINHLRGRSHNNLFDSKFFKQLALFFLVSILGQIVLSIIFENPF
jgi:hypothetical protein